MGRIEQLVESLKDLEIRNMESQQNVESGGENLGGYHVSLSDDEGTDVEFMSKETFIEYKDPKKMRISGNNSGASLEGIDQSF
ncbi:hypothetical protein Tco_0441039 [Tanacetum coccineum]